MLKWLQGGEDADALIARGQLDRAARRLRDDLRGQPDNARIRLKLADVLARADQDAEAVELLRPLVDQYAEQGFVAKAIAVLKKIERIAPSQRAQVAEQLGQLIRAHGDNKPAQPVPLVHPVPDTEEVTPATEPVVATSEMVLPEDWLDRALSSGSDLYLSPLFSGFTRDELAALMDGLRLQIKHPGAIIFSEGEQGDSLFILSSGSVRVYRRDGVGHNHQVVVLNEDTFFGVSSVLSGVARAATITAASTCELLELDRPALRRIAHAHPRVRTRLEAFYDAARKDGRVVV